jgi:hypothetical protein
VQLTVNKNGRAEFIYIHNGRGLASGMVRNHDPNSFAEKYRYELTGAAFMTEIDGISVAIPSRSTTVSSLLNSVLGGNNDVGSLLRDWQSGTFSGPGGRHLDPTIAAVLNSMTEMTGKPHNDARSEFGKQLSGFLNAMGFGNNGKGPSTAKPGKSSGFGFGPRNASLYSDSSDAPHNTSLVPTTTKDSNPAFDFSGKGGGSTGSSGGGMIGAVKDFLNTPVSIGPAGGLETNVGTLIGGLISGAAAGTSDPAKSDKPVEQPKLTEGQKAAEEAKKKEADDAKAAKEKKDADEKAEREKKEKEEKEKKEKEEKDKKKLVDPDSSTSTFVNFPSVAEIESRLNQRKHPVNPNGDGGTTQIDTSSPPPHKGGIDPTVALFDGESRGTVLSLSWKVAAGGGNRDPVRPDLAPEPPSPPTTGGTSPNVGKRWP